MALPGASKLNEEMVVEIKNLFNTTTLRDKEIAKMFNVSREHINSIRNGRRWNTETRSYISKKEMDMLKPQYIVPMFIRREKHKNFYDVLCDAISQLWNTIIKK